jgi:hypothetical protein
MALIFIARHTPLIPNFELEVKMKIKESLTRDARKSFTITIFAFPKPTSTDCNGMRK